MHSAGFTRTAEAAREGTSSRHAVTASRCASCGQPFTASRSDARYCSGACRQRALRQRRRTAPQARARAYQPARPRRPRPGLGTLDALVDELERSVDTYETQITTIVTETYNADRPRAAVPGVGVSSSAGQHGDRHAGS